MKYVRSIVSLFLIFTQSFSFAQTGSFDKAEVAFQSGEYDVALKWNEEAIRSFRKDSLYDSLVAGYIQRSQIIWDSDGIMPAMSLADSAIYFSNIYLVNDLSKIKSYNKKGQILVHAYRLEEARKTFEKAEDLISESIQNNSVIAGLYNNISWLYLNLQQLDDAFNYAMQSLEIQREIYGENDRRLMGVYQSLGLIANDLARYEEAEQYSLKLLELAETHLEPDHPTMALVHNQLAIIYETRFKYKDALNQMITMVDVTTKNYQKTGNPQFLAIAYNNTGNLYHQLHEFSLAEPYFEKALALHQQNYGIDDIGIVQSLSHLASTKLFLEKYEEADSLFKLAYQKQQVLENENIRILADLESQMGDLYAFQEDHQIAIEWFQKSLDHYASSGIEENFLKAETATSLAKEYVETGKFDEGIVLHFEALGLYQQLFPDEKMAISGKLNWIADSYLKAGSLEKALLYSDSTFHTILPDVDLDIKASWVENLPPNARIADFIFTRIQILDKLMGAKPSKEGLSEIIYLSDQYSQIFEKSIIGIRTQFSVIELAQKQKKILQKGMDAAWELSDRYGENEYLITAFFFSERGKAVLLRLASNNLIMESEEVEGNVLEETDHNFRNKISALNAEYLNSQSTGDDVLKLLTIELEKYGQFQDSVTSLNLPEWNKKYNLAPLSIGEIQSSLADQNQALIEFGVTEKFIYTFFLSKDDFQVFRASRDSLSKPIAQLGNLQRLKPKDFLEASYTIYKALIDPLYSKLNSNKLIIVPDAELFSINFETLVKDDSGVQFSDFNYLIREFEISYLLSASASQYFSNKGYSGEGKGLFMAPGFTDEMKKSYAERLDMDSTFAPIQSRLIRQPFSLQSAGFASKLWDGDFLEKDEAQETSFFRQASNAKIIHLATHGEANNISPLQSRLFFAPPNSKDTMQNEDGILHAYEVYSMQLNAELAVLSACNTGTGKFRGGEGVISLAHSFLHAGSAAVLMSLWAIDEKTSATILSDFFENLADGDTKSSALREAKLKFIYEAPEELAHPYYWAGMGIIGDPSTIEKPNNPVWTILGTLLLSLLVFYFLRKYFMKS